MFQALPTNLCLVASTRNQGNVLKLWQFTSATQCCQIDAHDPHNFADLRQYITARIKANAQLASQALALPDCKNSDDPCGEAAELLEKACDGNFLVASSILDDIAAERLMFSAVGNFDKALSLQSWYQASFARRFPLDTEDQRRAWHICQTALAIVIAEPVTEEVLLAMLRLRFSNSLDIRVPSQLAGYLVRTLHGTDIWSAMAQRRAAQIRSRHLALVHKSLSDWLTRLPALDDDSPYRVSVSSGHTLHAAFYLGCIGKQQSADPQFYQRLASLLSLPPRSLASTNFLDPSVVSSDPQQHFDNSELPPVDLAPLLSQCRLLEAEGCFSFSFWSFYMYNMWPLRTEAVVQCIIEFPHLTFATNFDKRDRIVRRLLEHDGFADIYFQDRCSSISADLASFALLQGWLYRHPRCLEFVRCLYERKADVNSMDQNDGLRPIHRAIASSNPEALQFLIDKGADPNLETKALASKFALSSRDKQAEVVYPTPLFWMIASDECFTAFRSVESAIECVRVLVGANCDVNALNADGDSTAMAAVANGFQQAAVFLLQQGARTDVINREGRTILHLACIKRFSTLVQTLAERSLDVECFDAHGLSAMAYALGSPGTLELLIANSKARTDVVTAQGNTLLHLAAAVTYFMDTPFTYASDMNLPDTSPSRNVHVERDQVHAVPRIRRFISSRPTDDLKQTIAVLLKFGVPIDGVNCDGSTAAIVAARFGNEEACSFLLECKASCEVVNKFGHRAVCHICAVLDLYLLSVTLRWTLRLRARRDWIQTKSRSW